MKTFLQAASVLLGDLASTFVFLAILLLTEHVPPLAHYGLQLGIASGIAFGVGQIGLELVRKKPVGVMQWLSLALVIGFGGASLITNDPRFVMFKPTLIYLIVGGVMLKPGWMTRYLPPIAQETIPDLGLVFGFVWAGLMFFSAALNVGAILLHVNVVTWAAFLSVYGLGSKLSLFLIQYAVMRFVGRRRYLAREAQASAMPAAA